MGGRSRLHSTASVGAGGPVARLPLQPQETRDSLPRASAKKSCPPSPPKRGRGEELFPQRMRGGFAPARGPCRDFFFAFAPRTSYPAPQPPSLAIVWSRVMPRRLLAALTLAVALGGLSFSPAQRPGSLKPSV